MESEVKVVAICYLCDKPIDNGTYYSLTCEDGSRHMSVHDACLTPELKEDILKNAIVVKNN